MLLHFFNADSVVRLLRKARTFKTFDTGPMYHRDTLECDGLMAHLHLTH